MAIETVPFDPADHLRSPQSQAELLTDAFASGEAAYIATALETVARARSRGDAGAGGKDTALPEGVAGADPRLSKVLELMRSLGMKLQVEPERA